MEQGMCYSKKDLNKARKRCEAVIGNKYKLPPLEPSCEISILVPVYDESIKRIDKQISAFSNQKFPKRKFELVYIVNNPPPDGSVERARAVRQNAKILKHLKKGRRLAVRVIDLSSKGRALKKSNVGIARNIGLHAVASRYLEQNRDGIVIHTDADTLPKSSEYLRKVYKEVSDPNCFGAAGGVEFILDIDSLNKADRTFFRKHIQTFRNFTEWHILVNALRKKSLPKVVASPTRFFGANMISKAIAGVLAGGIPEIGRAEDAAFGKNLERLAKKYGAKVLPRWDEWVMRTAFRESRRTGASFGPVFDNIRKHNGKPLVRSANAPHFFHEYLPKLLLAVRKTGGKRNALSALLGKHFDEASHNTQKAIMAFAKQIPAGSTVSARQHLYGAMKAKHLKDRPDLVFYAKYKEDFPLETLTPARLKALKKEVYKDPARRAFAEDAVKAFGQWKLPSESKKG